MHRSYYVRMVFACWVSVFLCGGVAGQGGTAVVVGISDYSSEGIQDLRFAHRDAAAVAELFRSVGIETKLLTDSAATHAAIESSLAWQRRVSKKNDLAIFYFAGHGDAEIVGEDKGSGFLLAHDSPPTNYPLTAIGTNTIDNHLSELTDSGAKVILISDACHAGDLAGGDSQGKKLTATQLLANHDNQIRILSCLPGEEALESDTWGGGRGVFSYFLEEAWSGRADDDQNQYVDLFEMERFVRKEVREATRNRQVPTIRGDERTTVTFQVLDDLAASKTADRLEDIQADFINGVISAAGPEVQQAYVRFQRALANGQLTYPEEGCAYARFLNLRETITTPIIVDILKEEMIVALLDSVQQSLVAYLDTDPQELQIRALPGDRWDRFVNYLTVAGDLMGEDDLRWRDNQAKVHYFRALQAMARAMEYHEYSIERRDGLTKALKLDSTAIAYKNNLAYAWNEKGRILYKMGDYTGALKSYSAAMDRAPKWAIPYSNFAQALTVRDPPGKSKNILDAYKKALELQPGYTPALINLGIHFQTRLSDLDSAIQYYKMATNQNRNSDIANYNLALALISHPDSDVEIGGTPHQPLALEVIERLNNKSKYDYKYLKGYIQYKMGSFDDAIASSSFAYNAAFGELEGIKEKKEQAYKIFIDCRQHLSNPGQFYTNVKNHISDHATDFWPYLAIAVHPFGEGVSNDEPYYTNLYEVDFKSQRNKITTLVEFGKWLSHYEKSAESIKTLTKASELNKDNEYYLLEPQYWLTLAHLTLRGGNEDDAVKAANEMVSFLPKHSPEEQKGYCDLFKAEGKFVSIADRVNLDGCR